MGIWPNHLTSINGPSWLARAVVRSLPQPDLVVSLLASPTETVRRRLELTVDEAASDGVAWSSMPVPQMIHVDASSALDEAVDRIFTLAKLEKGGPKSGTSAPT